MILTKTLMMIWMMMIMMLTYNEIPVDDDTDDYDLHQSCATGKGCPGPTGPVICQLNLEKILK